MESKTPKTELVRFTTLINPTILSNIKLISYFTNKKLYEVINQSIDNFVSEFETKNNTSIKSIIKLQHKLTNNPNEEVVEKNKDNK